VSAVWVHEALPGRVVFGVSRVAELPAEVDRLGVRRVVLVAAAEEDHLTAPLVAALGGRLAGRVTQVRQHVPTEVAEAARVRVAELSADGLVSVGGGSTTGTAKAVALHTGLPILAVPTTYAGSEMTPIWGMTDAGRKVTGVDPRVLPRTVIYDPELTRTLPPGLTAASGMNALAHCAEALWVPAADPVTSALAEEGIRALGVGLPRAVADGDDLAAREEVLLGACLAGRALAAAGTGLHHKLAHVLGGSFGLPHADVHSVLLPFTSAAEAAGHPDAMARIARALSSSDGPQALWDLGRAIGAPASLEELGFAAAQVEEAAAIVAEAGQHTHAAVVDVLRTALSGARPAAT